ncbi:colanic acid/amylovoran biosynthesis protein [Methylomarinovum caldicuralii]|uniref:Colanic acid/amylovoran biosynthesis protein n=2 Tax=Methylomarinovum caldicuralii TaxID=438856 RepID=A0AAU9C9A2_9GAMM|nr:colanic acid/amylovoran biosynthesis protein [Methylomarinovum caldicuralii]
MLLATLHMLKQHGVHKIGILTYNISDKYTLDPNITHYQMRDFFRFKSEEGLLRFVAHAQKHTHFYLIGADVMDGYYSRAETIAKIELARVAALCGLKTTLLGFSFNANPDEACVNALKTFPDHVNVNARDPVSHRRLSKHLGRNILFSADLAFLLPPDTSRSAVRNLVDQLLSLKREGRILVGINVSYLILGKAPTLANIDSLLAQVRSTLLEIATLKQNISFVLIPHDLRGPMNDRVLSERLAAGLEGQLGKNQIVHLAEPLNSAETKAVCAQLDAAFTCRMHFGIACLSQGVPIAAIGYQGKFEGLMELFGLEGLLLPDAIRLDLDAFSTVLRRLIENRLELQTIVRSKLDAVYRLAANNFSS